MKNVFLCQIPILLFDFNSYIMLSTFNSIWTLCWTFFLEKGGCTPVCFLSELICQYIGCKMHGDIHL